MSNSTNAGMVLMVEKRDGQVVPFDRTKIEGAIQRAALAAGKPIDTQVIVRVTDEIVSEIEGRFSDSEFTPNVENIHDIVEKNLVKADLYEVAKSYILYRAERRRKVAEERKKVSFLRKLMVKKSDGRTVLFNDKKVKETIERCAVGLDNINVEAVFEEAVKNIYNGIKSDEIDKALLLATTSFIELEPNYSYLAARIFQQRLRKEVFGVSTHTGTEEATQAYRDAFIHGIQLGVKYNAFDERLLQFDLNKLSEALVLERDNLFKFIGLQTLYERYFVKLGNRHIETPQAFWMRVAMGMAINEEDKEARAIEFYEVMSQFLYVPSTPTLFHSGLTHPQLSSCYLTTVDDDLHHIFQSFSDNAQLSKWSGGIGNDWSNIRSTGAFIASTKVDSQGVIPFLKIANDTTVAINRSGKRRGATVAYLETWHLDIEDFLDLRKNTGDERRRTLDMNTANWIPDLFMKRVREKGKWILFSPDEVPDLHHTYGKKFEERYVYYEKQAEKGKIKKTKTLDADKFYKKMISMLFETGHPWLCWKDPCNIRSPQDHVGVVHSSNLCTEITLNTSPTRKKTWAVDAMTNEIKLGEVAVCNLGSLNLIAFVKKGKIDRKKLASVIVTAMRMLDNVIDLNFYPIPEARHSNLKHRPVGLGIMAMQDVLFEAGINYEDSLDFQDELQEYIAYHAILASSNLAKERGAYETYTGSKWDRGIFPLDTVALLEEERGIPIKVGRTTRQDWDALKQIVKAQGMRNSNTMAVAPTATISTVVGSLGPCFEPVFKNIYVKSNMSGEFTVVNEFLVEDLKKLGVWSKDMLDQIKYHDGSIQNIEGVPAKLKEKYKEAFEIDPRRALEITAARGKWIDQSQSHNVFVKGNSGKLLYDLYLYAWELGLKTTYYLRTLGVTQIEKSTLDAKYGLTQKRDNGRLDEPTIKEEPVKLCRLNDPTCEACQ